MDLCQAQCRGRDQRAYRPAMRPTVMVLCAEHAAWLTGQGVTLVEVERRVAAVPVASDRRRWRAPWTTRNLGRDLTGLVR